MQTSTRGSTGRSLSSMSSPRRTPSAVSSTTSTVNNGPASQLTQHMAESMTIDEMRALHERALTDADAKRTELRLVLASRYRELVGSSDEVIKMKERADELLDLVNAIPQIISKLADEDALEFLDETKHEEKENDVQAVLLNDDNAYDPVPVLRRDLSTLPCIIYRALDSQDVHSATVTLIDLFTLIAQQTDAYPLATCLSREETTTKRLKLLLDTTTQVQIQMTFLQVQSLPDKIRRICLGVLARSASYDLPLLPITSCVGSSLSAAALVALDCLETTHTRGGKNNSEYLLTTYFESKAKLLASLLSQLTIEEAANAETVLSKIVLILQYDIVLHPYQIFCIRSFPDSERIIGTLPEFDRDLVKIKCSKFLASHLPLIRSKVKSVLISIAGTTASALGQIRQSLYDKTDGAESLNRLNGNGICTWEEAVTTLVDSRTVFADSEASQQNRFSLWSSLFSHTFSSLVHSLLTTSFQSVHTSVVSTLRVSLANAPPISSILPHEAYRNTLKLATDLDRSLLKVSEDAHELLVHAEERVESERRLRQSLYVQTCEIMGRLICELRRMIHRAENDNSDATRELIVGRLCFLLKFRLPSLRFLLSPDSSPASMNSTSGMISFIDLQTAFELADDNEEGVISFEDAMEAVESAFAGTPFHGAEILRETLILSTEGKRLAVNHPSASLESPSNVTLHELTLLTARGLRHDRVGALPAVQFALDKIIDESLGRWAKLTMDVSSNVLKENVANFFGTASTVSNDEWVRMFSNSSPRETFTCRGVSPHWVGFFLDMISALNSSTCPPDFLTPVPTDEYATSLGCTLSGTVPTCVESLRRALLVEVFDVALRLLEESVLSESGSRFTINGAAATVQLHVDVSFLNSALQRYLLGHVALNRSDPFKQRFYAIVQRVDNWTQTHCTKEMLTTLTSSTNDNQNRVFETSDLFFSTLSGNSLGTSVPAVADFVESSEGTTPMFHGPLLSSRRFTLLPVQTDRSINDIQLRGTYAKEKERTSQKPDTSSGNVISGGFGFLSNMLKTKK